MSTESGNNRMDYNEKPKEGASERVETPSHSQNPLSNYLFQILTVYCQLKHIKQAAIIRGNSDKSVHVLSVCPNSGAIDPKQRWLGHSARMYSKVISENRTILQPFLKNEELYGQHPNQHLLMIPFDISEMNALVAVFLVETKDPTLLERLCNQVQHGFYLLSLSETRVRSNANPASAKRLTQAIRVSSNVNQQDKFTSAAMAFCNEIATQWHCERVSLGFLKGRYVQIKAMNHTEEFYRKMDLIQNIESAMEECLDQDTEILVPVPQETCFIYRATQNLADRGNPRTILSFPLRQQGKVFAVLTLERIFEKPFLPDEIETLRLSCELCSARMADLYQHDRWFGSLLAERARKMFAGLLGPTHTWGKVAGIVFFLILVFLIFAKGQFRPDSPFVLEAVEQQVIPTPFDGYLKTVEVDVGDTVQQDTSVLATLDTAELRLQLAAAQADKVGYLKQVSAAMRDNETAQAQIAQANADKAQAQIDLLNHQINQSRLTTPLGGVVVKGDLKRQIGAPVKTGDILFEVCPLESIRAQLLVPDDLVLYMEVGQEGRLATASYPDKPIRFVVERIDPMAEVVNQRNVFKVRARLLETYPWMRPGMEGVAKVEVGKKRYVWIWTRKLTNWVRMKLWL